MADAASSVVDYFKGNMVFVNVMKNMSVDCDCCAVAEDPCMKDIGILVSLDPVAVDQACLDLVYASQDPGRDHRLKRIESRHGVLTVLDASLLQDNLYFIKTREKEMQSLSVREITRKIADLFDIIYFSARKFGFARGGAILVRDEALFHSMEDLVPMFEGFLTYGGMSVKEMEAMTVGFEESMDMDVISQGPQFIDYCVDRLSEYGIPVITPGGGLGAHIDVKEFLPHVPQTEYSACALACALYICGGIRGMERGTLSEERERDGSERIASMELLRLAFPRRVFTLSQTEYVIDRVKWLFDHRDLVGGLRFVHEPATLRFFTGVLEPTSDWPEKLAAAYRADFGDEQ